MTAQKSVKPDRTAAQSAPQPGATDIEQSPPKLRNPVPVGPTAPGRPLRPGEQSLGGGASDAANGFWLHDTIGPTGYADPRADSHSAGHRAAADLIARVEERLGYLHGFDASRIHVSIIAGAVVLSGQVESAEARRRAGACAVAAAQGVPVQNRIIVDR